MCSLHMPNGPIDMESKKMSTGPNGLEAYLIRGVRQKPQSIGHPQRFAITRIKRRLQEQARRLHQRYPPKRVAGAKRRLESSRSRGRKEEEKKESSRPRRTQRRRKKKPATSSRKKQLLDGDTRHAPHRPQTHNNQITERRSNVSQTPS
jgi:hypothetical protein